jgi:hypothetical protein
VNISSPLPVVKSSADEVVDKMFGSLPQKWPWFSFVPSRVLRRLIHSSEESIWAMEGGCPFDACDVFCICVCKGLGPPFWGEIWDLVIGCRVQIIPNTSFITLVNWLMWYEFLFFGFPLLSHKIFPQLWRINYINFVGFVPSHQCQQIEDLNKNHWFLISITWIHVNEYYFFHIKA